MGCFVCFKYAKIHWRPGFLLGHHWGAHDAPPDVLVGWGGGHRDSRAFGASILVPPRGSLVPLADLELATVLVRTKELF